QDFLRANGVRDLDSYRSFINSDSDAARQFASTLALQSMSLTSDISFRSVGSRETSPIGSTRTMTLSEGEYRMMRQAAQDVAGEDLDDTYAVTRNGNNYDLARINDSTNLARIVSRTSQLH